MTSKMLPEISESTSDHTILAIYNDIKAVLGTPNVNLIFRQIATIPGGLEYVWTTLRPLHINQSIKNASSTLISDLRLDPAIKHSLVKKAHYLSPKNILEILYVLESYKYANPINLIGIEIILICLQNNRASVEIQKTQHYNTEPSKITKNPKHLLPMSNLDGLPKVTMEKLKFLANIVPGANNVNIPSLYRHFGAWPELLDDISVFLQTIFANDKGITDIKKMHNSSKTHALKILTTQPAGKAKPINYEKSRQLQSIIMRFPINMCALTIIAIHLIKSLHKTNT